MRKTFVIIFVAFILCSVISPVAYAALGDVHTVNSPMARPEVSIVQNGTSKTYTIAFMRQLEAGPSNERAEGSYLNIVTFTIPDIMDVVFYPRNYNSWFLWVSNPILYHVDMFDLETGNLIDDLDWHSVEDASHAPDTGHTYYISPRAGYYPSQTVYNSHLLGAYYYIPEGITIKSGSTQGYYPDWVNWATRPLDTHILHSFTSEPVYDYLNRYIVLGGNNDGYIYHIGFYAPEITAYLNSSTTNITFLDYNYFFAPQLKLTDSGLSLTLHVDSDLLNFWTNINSGGLITYYDVMISKYRLSDGQYVGSSLYSGNTEQDYTINYDFGSLSDFNSIKTYGVHYIDESYSRHFNLLTCIWGTDPDFITWRNSISSQLDTILSTLRGDGTQTTLPIDSEVGSQVDSYVSQEDDIMSQMDDVGGQIDDVFDEAESQFTTASSGFSFIKMLLERFVFNVPHLYIVVFFSLTFGLVVLVIGRSMNG